MWESRSHKSYRPLTVLTFRWNYAMSELNPAAYHLTNVVLHAMVCALLFKVSKTMFGGDSRAAVVACVVFAVHSVHTEAVGDDEPMKVMIETMVMIMIT